MQVGRGSSGAFAITPAPGGAFRNVTATGHRFTAVFSS
jgi:hypothetical protein